MGVNDIRISIRISSSLLHGVEQLTVATLPWHFIQHVKESYMQAVENIVRNLIWCIIHRSRVRYEHGYHKTNCPQGRSV